MEPADPTGGSVVHGGEPIGQQAATLWGSGGTAAITTPSGPRSDAGGDSWSDPDGLAVVTVAYHSGACLPQLARDLARQSRPPDHWILVDHSPLSSPLDLPPLRQGGLAPQRVAGLEGAGFGEGCNLGFSTLAAQGWTGWIWLLNPDIRLPAGDELERLLGALGTLSPRALVGTAVLDGLGELEASAGWLTAGLDFRGERLGSHHATATSPLAVDWLSGCSLALQPQAHRPPARFDRAFPLYYEDMDLCRRLGHRGAPVVWLSQPAVHHGRGSGSATPSPRRLRLSTLGYLRFLRRHCPPWVMAVRGARLVLLNVLRLPIRPHRSAAALGAAFTVALEGGEPR